jgi:flagellin
MSDLLGGISGLVAQRAARMQRLALNQAQHRLATGQRLNRAADNPAAMVASISMDATLAALEAETAANQRAMHQADTADAALGQISDQLIEAKKLALANANSAGPSDAEKQANQLEIDSILSGVDRMARTTSFNGTKLLDGTATLWASGAKFKIAAVTTTEIDPTDPESLDEAITQVATQRAQIGAFSKHTLQSRLNQISTEKSTLLSAVSFLRDAEMAMEATARIRAELLESASLRVLKQSGRRTSRMLDLFG